MNLLFNTIFENEHWIKHGYNISNIQYKGTITLLRYVVVLQFLLIDVIF